MKISHNIISTKSSKTQLLNLMNTNQMALTCICGVEHLKDLHKAASYVIVHTCPQVHERRDETKIARHRLCV